MLCPIVFIVDVLAGPKLVEHGAIGLGDKEFWAQRKVSTFTASARLVVMNVLTHDKGPYRSAEPALQSGPYDPERTIRYCADCGLENAASCVACANAPRLPLCPWPKSELESARKFRLLHGAELDGAMALGLLSYGVDFVSWTRHLLRAPASERSERGWQRALLGVAIVAAALQSDPRRERAFLEAALQHLSEGDLNWACRRLMVLAAQENHEVAASMWWPSELPIGSKLESHDPLVQAITGSQTVKRAAMAIQELARRQMTKLESGANLAKSESSQPGLAAFQACGVVLLGAPSGILVLVGAVIGGAALPLMLFCILLAIGLWVALIITHFASGPQQGEKDKAIVRRR